jgi:hypothetical protein
MSDKLNRMWMEVAMAQLRYYPNIYLEGLRITTKRLSHNSQCPSQELNCSCLEYKSRELQTDQAA